NKKELLEIKNGIYSLNKLNAYNYTQALVVRNNSIVAKENSRGTKKMLQSIIKAKNNQGILIKFPKKKQDLRADLPTIGLDTIKDCKKANLKGLVLKANQNIFLDRVKSIIFANKNKIFIKVI
ncbi:LpxI family protein, partial [Candidatus Pelagibacter sp.]|nr:LpxI family protein [Candidatus Pelagibacter sp.]